MTHLSGLERGGILRVIRPAGTLRRRGRCRGTLSSLAVIVLLASAGAHAQPAGRTYRIGLLAGGSSAGSAPVRTAVVTGLGELGYREGEGLVLVERYADGKFERLPRLATELVRLGVDVILTSTTPAALAAKQATSTIPIVVVTSGDLLGAGIVSSLARPGGNVTGLSFLGTELAVKQLDLLRQIVPALRKVAFLANRSIQPEVLFFTEMERAAPGLGVRVRFVDAKGLADYDAAFTAMAREGAEGLVVAPNLTNIEHRQRIVDLAARVRLPAVYQAREFAEAGGLVSYGVNRSVFFRRAAAYVDRVLRGARPADLPIEQPTTFELVVNLGTARALGVSMPPAVLVQADQILGN